VLLCGGPGVVRWAVIQDSLWRTIVMCGKGKEGANGFGIERGWICRCHYRQLLGVVCARRCLLSSPKFRDRLQLPRAHVMHAFAANQTPIAKLGRRTEFTIMLAVDFDQIQCDRIP